MTTILYLLASLLFMPPQPKRGEQLLLFIQKEDQYFTTNVLPQLREYAEKNEIPLQVKETGAGVPKEITSTPALVFFTARGRSVYAGRYAEFSTIENFIRTSRVAVQIPAENCRESILTRKEGRMQVIAPLKITELQGSIWPELDQTGFRQALEAGIEEGAIGFSRQTLSCINRTDRAFYLDVHPYVDKQQSLYLSYAVFSQFDCINPIATSGEQPISGSWVEREQLFLSLGQKFEAIVSEVLDRSTNGDALTAIPSVTASAEWKDYYEHSEATKESFRIEDAENWGPLPTEWIFAGPIAPDFPVIQFQFQAPLDRYAGEVQDVSGKIALLEDGSLNNGAFTVKTAGLTMGMPDLDEKVHRKYIRISRFPEATFQFSDLKSDSSLEWGKISRLSIPGTFQLMRYRKPVLMSAELQPLLDENGEPILLVSARFQLNITDDFGIAGPDGPAEATKTMHFNLNFLMR
jgi:hypothetical protein